MNPVIKGIKSQSLPTKQQPKKPDLLETFVGLGILIIIFLFTMKFRESHSLSLKTSATKPECVIKGNISVNSGTRIYHLPGMEYYELTIINPSRGERWFCTESEAIANGWRKSLR